MRRALTTCALVLAVALLGVSCATNTKPLTPHKPHEKPKDATIVLTDDGKGGCEILASGNHEADPGEHVYWVIVNLCLNKEHNIKVGSFVAKGTANDKCSAEGVGDNIFGKKYFGKDKVGHKRVEEFHEKVKETAAEGEYKYCIFVDETTFLDPTIYIRPPGA